VHLLHGKLFLKKCSPSSLNRQLCVGKHIFHWLDEEEVKEKILQGIRPDKPKGMDKKLINKNFYQLMQKCWGQAPENRISMNNVLAYFHRHPSVALGPAAIFMVQARVNCTYTS
jgi:hypothetical protein